MPAGHILALSRDLGPLSQTTTREIERAYVDTLAVLCAGWNEPVTRALRNAYPNVEAPWDSTDIADAEAAALTWGTAAHALDYDDVHMTSVTHPSAVLIPAIEAAARLDARYAGRRAGAFAVGLAVNVALGLGMGFRHYAHGWHATSTIGAVAAGAAIAHLFGLEGKAFRSSLAIAAAQSGGLQRNFGTMAKPLQAGLAAQAGIRAARLAMAGVDGPDDVLIGRNGYLAVFQGDPDVGLEFDIDAAASGLSRKLFACCYLAHRPVAAAIRLHGEGVASMLDNRDVTIDVEVPPGCLQALTIGIPASGAEAKFSGQYTVAHALLTGRLSLSAFLPESLGRTEILNLARRVSLREAEALASTEVGIDRGAVTVSVMRKDRVAASTSLVHYPGSPAAPMTDDELDAKLLDCIAVGAVSGSGLETKFHLSARQFAGSA